MCLYSAIGPMFEPVIPFPTPKPQPQVDLYGPQKQWPWGPVPSTGLPIAPEDLKALLDAFHKAVSAAKAADKAAGQPDCVDQEKVKLEDRVAELERRLAAFEAARERDIDAAARKLAKEKLADAVRGLESE